MITFLKENWLLLLISLALLSPVLSFPLGNDHAIFLLGGDKLLDGGVLYQDFIDIKPPLIFYIYSVINLIFGYGDLPVRVFELIWQFFTVLSLLIILNSHGFKRIEKFAAAIAYSVLYTGLDNDMSMQIETLAALPLIWAVHLTLKRDGGLLQWLLIGMLLGIVTALKYTLGIALLALLAYDLLKIGMNWLFVRKYLTVCLAMIIAFLLGILPLFDQQVWQGYRHVLEFIAFYSSTVSSLIGQMRNGLKLSGGFFGDNFSLFFVFSYLLALFSFFKDGSIKDKSKNNFIALSLAMTFFLVISIIVEGKYMLYHFSRIYVFAAPIVALGIVRLIELTKNNFSSFDRTRKLIFFVLVVGAVLLSPLPRFGKEAMDALKALKSIGHKISCEDEWNKTADEYTQMEAVASFLDENYKPGNTFLFMGTGMTRLSTLLEMEFTSRFGHSQFYFSLWVPEPWQKGFVEELKSVDWVIVQNNDRFPTILGHSMSSEESLAASDDYEYFLENFELKYSTDVFAVYERTSD
jgi:hypothetical protein